jgi:hypothetical protein
MVQNPKGGGLSSTGMDQLKWVAFKKQLTFRQWTLATILIALILLSSLSYRDIK